MNYPKLLCNQLLFESPGLPCITTHTHSHTFTPTHTHIHTYITIIIINNIVRHAPQNLSMPIEVQIIPTNDNDPVITLKTIETNYIENAPPTPVLAGFNITDDDEYCENDQLTAARVQMDTLTNDRMGDQLMVMHEELKDNLEHRSLSSYLSLSNNACKWINL